VSRASHVEPDAVERRRTLAAIDDPGWILLKRGEAIARGLERDGLCYRRKKRWCLTDKGARRTR
jgi:hypothetical protein